MILKSCTGRPIYISPISLRVTCVWLTDFRLYLPHICLLPEMKKIESVLCIKFSSVFSNAYDKTELDYHATKPQRKEDSSKQHCKLILS